MRQVKWVVVAMLLCIVGSTYSKDKNKPKAVYVFGFAASFSDTIVCYTDIQKLDSGAVDGSGFLKNRATYSAQLKNYLESAGIQKNSTAMIYFSDSEKKMAKEADKLIGKYRKNKNVALRNIPASDFLFTRPDTEE